MTTLNISLEGQAEQELQEMSSRQGIDPVEMASRLLKRAIRAARPKPVYDIPALQAAYAEFAEEDVALAESGLEHRAEPRRTRHWKCRSTVEWKCLRH